MVILKRAGLALMMTAWAAAAQAAPPDANAVTGRWYAALSDHGAPVRLDLVRTDGALKAVFHDGGHDGGHDGQPGDTTTRASFRDGTLVLTSDHYLTTAALKGGELVGDTTLQGPGYRLHYGFHAVRHVEAPSATVTEAEEMIAAWTEDP